MKVLIINGSHRNDGSTKILVDKFKEESKDKVDLKEYDLSDVSIDFFNYESKYSKEDYFDLIKNEMLNTDMIVFSSPIYWYCMSAKLKSFFDRFNSMFATGEIKQLENKKVVVLFTYGAQEFDDCFVKPFELMADYMKMDFVGSFGVQSTFPKGIREEKSLLGVKAFVEKILE